MLGGLGPLHPLLQRHGGPRRGLTRCGQEGLSVARGAKAGPEGGVCEPNEGEMTAFSHQIHQLIMMPLQKNKVPSCNQDCTPRLNWEINETIYRRKGGTGGPPWRLKAEPGTEGRRSHAWWGGHWEKGCWSRGRVQGWRGLGSARGGDTPSSAPFPAELPSCSRRAQGRVRQEPVSYLVPS